MREELPEIGERLLTTRQVANLYGVNEKMVPAYVGQKRIPPPLADWKGKGNRWLASDVVNHMRSLRSASEQAIAG